MRMTNAEEFPRAYRCHHDKPHTILIRDSIDEMALALFRHDGWERAGYCLAYMPLWLRPRYQKEVRAMKADAEIAWNDCHNRTCCACARCYDALKAERDQVRAALLLVEKHMCGPGGHGCVCRCPTIDSHNARCPVAAALALLKRDAA